MENKQLYRVIVIGPTGAGKSQFCNFIQRDTSNSINKVSDSLDSCTQEPFSNFFSRKSTNYEFIDTPGSADSYNNDVDNLKKLVIYLKEKKSIDYILLLLKFNERVTKDTREYIETLGKIFTPGELNNHLSVIFTKFPINPSKKEEKIKKKSVEEINIILKNAFNIDKNQAIPEVKVYFIDTEVDEDEKTYEKKYQDTIDIMMDQMKLDVKINGIIVTKDLDSTGESVKNRFEIQKEQIEKLKKALEQQEINNKKQEEEKERLLKEIEKERENKELVLKKERQLQEIMEKQRVEKLRLEELALRNQRMYEENQRKQKLIEEEAKKKGIKIEKLDKIIDGCKGAAAGGIICGIVSGVYVGGIIATLFLCPTLLPCQGIVYELLYGTFLGTMVTGVGGAGVAVSSGVVAAGAKIKKNNI